MDRIQALEDFAMMAVTRAEKHGIAIGLDDVAAADRALDRETQLQQSETASLFYGAWLGRLAVRKWGGRWVGLSEPTPPRVSIRGFVVSPIDAVGRRLLNSSAPTMAAIAALFESWSRSPESAAAANRQAWDELAEDSRFAGLHSLPPDPRAALDEWLRDEVVEGKTVLCLGAGGGRHGPLLAAAGASVTVVDFSDRQLNHDREVGAILKLPLRSTCLSIDDLGPLAAASFDIVVQPVSACYVPDVERVYAEVARVIRPGGLYVVQHKQPASLQAGGDLRITRPAMEGAALPPSTEGHREPGTVEYVHTLDSLLGGLCRAGFVIEDVEEPPRADALAPAGSPGHRAWFLPPYLKIKARRLQP